MKIVCDVCEKDEALVLCAADEAALCGACDRRVHYANKLASKHPRFSLFHPFLPHFPLCDICQERRAFLFCQQDRAILCTDCDFSIHSVNENTQKHNRFLLSGIQLCRYSAAETPSSSSEASLCMSGTHSLNPGSSQPLTIEKTAYNIASATCSNNSPSIAESSTSNAQTEPSRGMSEFLLETLPGWQFEDQFLHPPPSSHHFGPCKSDYGEVEMMGDSCSSGTVAELVEKKEKAKDESFLLNISLNQKIQTIMSFEILSSDSLFLCQCFCISIFFVIA